METILMLMIFGVLLVCMTKANKTRTLTSTVRAAVLVFHWPGKLSGQLALGYYVGSSTVQAWIFQALLSFATT